MQSHHRKSLWPILSVNLSHWGCIDANNKVNSKEGSNNGSVIIPGTCCHCAAGCQPCGSGGSKQCFPSAAPAPCLHMGWEGQKNQLAMRDINGSQVQIQLQKHFAERLMYLEKTNGHLCHFSELLVVAAPTRKSQCSHSVQQLCLSAATESSVTQRLLNLLLSMQNPQKLAHLQLRWCSRDKETHQIVWRQKQPQGVIAPTDTRMCSPASTARPRVRDQADRIQGLLLDQGIKLRLLSFMSYVFNVVLPWASHLPFSDL